MFANLNCKNLLLLIAPVTFVVGTTSSAQASHTGIYWYLNQTTVTFTLINLTGYQLNTTDTSTMTTSSCNSFPLEYGTNSSGVPNVKAVAPYSSISWKTTIESYVAHYNGRITLLPAGMDPKWSVNVVFSAYKISYFKDYGTYVYLEAKDTSDTSGYGWYPGWLDGSTQAVTEFWGYDLYTTPLTDGHLHNQMNLLGYDVAVSMFSGNNSDITLVVQQTKDQAGGFLPFRGWELNWVDNNGDDFP